MEEKRIRAYKAFDENLRICNFPFEIGKEYDFDETMCVDEFTAYENPLDAMMWYDNHIEGDRFCIVELYGDIVTNGVNSKRVSSKMKIIEEINMEDLLKAGLDWIQENTISQNANCTTEEIQANMKKDAVVLDTYPCEMKIVSSFSFAQIFSRNYRVHINSCADYAMIGSEGSYAKISSSGDYAIIGSDGYQDEILSSGDKAMISSINLYAKISTSGKSTCVCSQGENADIITNSSYGKILSLEDFAEIHSNGYRSMIFSSGKNACINISGFQCNVYSSGDNAIINSSGTNVKIESTGKNCIITCLACRSLVKARVGSLITIIDGRDTESHNTEIPFEDVKIKTIHVDGENIKEDTWYKFIDGELKEAGEDDVKKKYYY